MLKLASPDILETEMLPKEGINQEEDSIIDLLYLWYKFNILLPTLQSLTVKKKDLILLPKEESVTEAVIANIDD